MQGEMPRPLLRAQEKTPTPSHSPSCGQQAQAGLFTQTLSVNRQSCCAACPVCDLTGTGRGDGLTFTSHRFPHHQKKGGAPDTARCTGDTP